MKTINMKKQLSFAFSLSALAFFAACGDNVTDNAPVATQAYDGQEDFPDCDKDYEGMFATVKSKRELYICTANKWINLTTGQAVSDKGDSQKAGCTSKELSDGSGVQVICDGDTVAVLKNGKTGSKGSTGPEGDTGKPGDAGTPGNPGRNGSDAEIDPNRCMLKYSGSDVAVYDCSDSAYVETKSMKTSTAASWKAFQGTSITTAANFNGYSVTTIYSGHEGATGTLSRYDGDNTWTSPATLGYAVRIKGTATVNVTEAQTVSADKYRPFVGARFTYSSSGIDVSYRGGVCVTYSSEEDMNVLIEGETGFLKASLPATENDEVAVKDIGWLDFEPVAEGVDFEKALINAKYAYIELAGGTDVDTYENTFSIYQFGNYGNCTNVTYKSNVAEWIEALQTRSTPAADLVYGGVTYKTVKIGNQTWMAENLRYGSGACVYGSDDENCSGYGRAYTWLQALGDDADGYNCSTSAVCDDDVSGAQGICPSGWHLPTVSEWGTVISKVMDGSGYTGFFTSAGAAYVNMALLSEKSQYGNENLSGLGLYTAPANTGIYYWTSTEYSSGSAEMIYYYANYGYVYADNPRDDDHIGANYIGYYTGKSNAYAVRCVKN